MRRARRHAHQRTLAPTGHRPFTRTRTAPRPPPTGLPSTRALTRRRARRRRAAQVADAPDANAFVAYQMYALIREFVVDTVLSANLFDYGEEMTVLGGIQVNRASGGDVFMPMMLQTRGKEEGTTVDLYEETFGAPPETKLREVLAGSNIDLYDYKLAKSVQPAVNM